MATDYTYERLILQVYTTTSKPCQTIYLWLARGYTRLGTLALCTDKRLRNIPTNKKYSEEYINGITYASLTERDYILPNILTRENIRLSIPVKKGN